MRFELAHFALQVRDLRGKLANVFAVRSELCFQGRAVRSFLLAGMFGGGQVRGEAGDAGVEILLFFRAGVQLLLAGMLGRGQLRGEADDAGLQVLLFLRAGIPFGGLLGERRHLGRQFLGALDGGGALNGLLLGLGPRLLALELGLLQVVATLAEGVVAVDHQFAQVFQVHSG
ncbi:MAG: hypothetical protein ACLQU1_38560 [Bryobacteraceae bacterium]